MAQVEGWLAETALGLHDCCHPHVKEKCLWGQGTNHDSALANRISSLVRSVIYVAITADGVWSIEEGHITPLSLTIRGHKSPQSPHQTPVIIQGQPAMTTDASQIIFTKTVVFFYNQFSLIFGGERLAQPLWQMRGFCNLQATRFFFFPSPPATAWLSTPLQISPLPQTRGPPRRCCHGNRLPTRG